MPAAAQAGSAQTGSVPARLHRKGMDASLPRLLQGRRRWLMAALVGTGLLMAAAAGASALLMIRLLDGSSPAGAAGILPLGFGLAATALGLGVLRAAERLLAEKLGQDYIHEIRKGLVAASLASDRGPSPGVTIARNTNDLSSIRNWIALGIAPLAVGIPLILGTAAALWFLSPALALAVVVPLLLLAAVLALLSRPAFRRAQELRRQRGRLAARLADTVIAAGTIRAAGGEEREVKQIDKAGRKVVDAAVHRAAAAGYIRGAAAAAASLGSAAVAAVGTWQMVPTAAIAAGLTIVGMISAPVTDMGRVVEYRQNFRAARRILGPALAVGAAANQERRRRLPAAGGTGAREAQIGAASAVEGRAAAAVNGAPVPDGPHHPARGRVLVDGLAACRNCPAPPLSAGPGSRIRIRSADPAAETQALEILIGIQTDAHAVVMVDGEPLLASGGRRRRRLVGYAATGMYLERGSIARSVRYRRPDLPPADGSAALVRVGLAGRIAKLERGEETQLKRGGEPLSTSELARLLLARASIGTPPLLVLNRLDADLDRSGTAMLADFLRDYPGVVLFASDHPDSLGVEHTEWNLDCAHAGLDLVWHSHGRGR
ncbi:ABC transporter transmembrane domain-containing protein [Arthrobacter sulfonylureivorans]|uniref:ABC transporter transmembrane domain-containing protein n=1 Tax=Arthrobacter sulfonylureivorans TaxID=2486855 RepID=UPI0039E6C715